MPNYYNETNLRQLDSLNVDSYGIIDRIGSVAMSDTARVVVIGVGGMGLKTITALKKELQARVGRIDRNYIRFLSIDTSSTEISTATQSGALTKEEAPYLDNSSLGAVFRLPRAQQPSYLSGIMSENALPVTFRGDGANQIRMAGRLSLLESTTYNGVVTAIRSAISGLKDFVTKTLEVYVVGGVGGGTGSGMIVDIPYIVRKVANTLGVNERLRLMGYIYLPDVYDPCANGTPNTGNLEAAYRNGYAALKEIDYYMNIAETGETYDAEYAD
ncbi:MAG: hypothetical protein IIW19_05575, partial [Clostridia bacterium]|nr:hypothetical protein [Clostridia bacterium]